MCMHAFNRIRYHTVDSQILSCPITENFIHVDRIKNKFGYHMVFETS